MMTRLQQLEEAIRTADREGRSADVDRLGAEYERMQAERATAPGWVNTVADAGDYWLDAARSATDVITRGYFDKLSGPKSQAETAAAQDRLGAASIPVDIGAALMSSPYTIRTALAGGGAGALEGALSAYGHEKNWVPHSGQEAVQMAGDIGWGAGKGAVLGTGAAKAGEIIGKGWDRLFSRGRPTPPSVTSNVARVGVDALSQQGPRVSKVGNVVQKFGDLPRAVSLPADAMLAHVGLPPFLTTGSTVAEMASPLFRPKPSSVAALPESVTTARMRDLFAKMAASYGRSP